MLKIHCSDDINAFDDVWRHCESQGAMHPFQSLLFCKTWYDVVAPKIQRKPYVVLVELDSQPVMLFPLALRRRYGQQVLEFCGGLLCDYEAPVLTAMYPKHQNFEMRALWKRIIQNTGADVAHLRQIVTNIPDADGIFINNPLCQLRCHPSTSAYGLHADSTTFSEQLVTNTPKRILQDTRRQEKRLLKLGGYSFSIAQNLSDVQEYTETMIAFKKQRYKTTGVFDIFSVPGHESFYTRLNEILFQAESNLKLHVSALCLGSVILAVHWGLMWRNIYYYLMPAHNADWGQFSCGRLLLQTLLMQAFEKERCTYFDFTVGDESYKRTWSNCREDVYMACHPMSVMGHLYSLLLRYRHGLP